MQISHYFKTGIRNLLRHKVFSLINISGLALGMTCSLLILLWVKDELSFNRFHKNLDQLYRVMEEQHYPGGEDLFTSSTPGPLASALKEELPEVKESVKFTWEMEQLLTHGEKVFKEKGLYAEPGFFTMFTFPFLQGQPEKALSQPHSIVISEKVAQKYFGSAGAAFNQTLKVNNQDNYKITGVVQDVPKNSSLQFEFVMPFADFESQQDFPWLKDWGNNAPKTYVQLQPDTDVEALNKKIRGFHKKHKEDSHIDLFLQPVKDMYLLSDFRPGKEVSGRIVNVRLFSVVALFVLVIACINFMNLSTARSVRRAKEVGVRKVVGAPRSAIIGQFMGESILIALLACLVAVNLTQLLLPSFNALTEKAITIHYSDPEFIFSVLGIALFTGVLSGSYPALFMSSFQPIAVLKGALRLSSREAAFRKGLVVFQFFLSAVFIISTLVVYRQIHFIKNKNIGLDRENVIYVPLEGDLEKSYNVFKAELKRAPGIREVTAASQNPISVGSSTGGINWEGKDPAADILFTMLETDYDFLKTMNIKLKDGRDFSPSFTDTASFLINEEALRLMQLKNPIGQKLSGNRTGQIIGVVEDFQTNSMHTGMQPVLISLGENMRSCILVKAEAGKAKEAIASIGQLFKKHNPAYPFDYDFLDDDFNSMYKSETIIGKLATYFSGIAIFISCLGLFGLALFMAEQRTKEIGIRKVLGASVAGIVSMLSKDFVRLVLLANLIALPFGWYLMNNWLENYAFRTEMSWWIFAIAFIATICIALLTVSFHAVRTAIANPVTSLRSE
jgi:putative ABC transport system permease protein